MAYSKNRRLAEIVSDVNGNVSVEGLIVPTQSNSDNDTSAASTAFVHAHVNALVDSAPGTLNTLNELAAALNDDANFNTTISAAVNAKLPKAGGTLTGNVATSGTITFDNNAQAIKIKDAAGTAGYVFYLDNQDTLVVGNGTIVEKIRLDTSGNEGAITIDTDGKVGIGIIPRAKLDIFQQTNRTSKTGTTRGVLHLQDGDTPSSNELTAITFESNSNNAASIIGQSLTNSGSSLFFGTSNSYGSGVTNTAMSINHLGNVGIGLASPNAKLHLYGSSSLSEMYLGEDAATDKAGILKYTQGNGSGTGVITLSHYGNNSNTDSIAIKYGGKVGIGNNNPYFPLHVQGANVTNGQAKNNILAFDTASATTGTGGGIAFGGYTNGTGGDLYHFGNIQGIKENSTAGNYASAMIFSTRANGATPTEKMRINSAGIVTKPYTPAFSCNSSGNYTTTTGDQNIKTFASSNAVSLNIGGHLSGGKFTAPVDGLYHFDLKGAATYSSGYLFMYIWKNGAAMSNHYHYMFQTSNSATLSFTVYADKDDYFEPYINSNYSGGTVSAVLFSGHLIG